MMHPRTAIRKYIVDMLKDSVDVGGKVYANRPSRIFIPEAPCVLVYFGTEPVEIEGGDRYCAHEYSRDLQLKVDVLSVEDEDHLDYLGDQIEKAFGDDWFLGKRFPDYDPESPCGLSRGVLLSNTEPYSVDTDSEIPVYGQTITFNVAYITDNYSSEKHNMFEQYYFEIRRTDGVETDPVLSSGEGDL